MKESRPPIGIARRQGWYVLWASALAIGVVAVIASLTHAPWVFPSLGPTVYVLLIAPYAAEASPRNTICGHAIGITVGVLSLTVFGLWEVAPDLEDLKPARVGAVIVALALTLALMTWIGVPHAPAAATTLIIALGLLNSPRHIALMLVSVVVTVITAWVINRLHGDRPPLWSPKPQLATSADAG